MGFIRLGYCYFALGKELAFTLGFSGLVPLAFVLAVLLGLVLSLG